MTYYRRSGPPLNPSREYFASLDLAYNELAKLPSFDRMKIWIKEIVDKFLIFLGLMLSILLEDIIGITNAQTGDLLLEESNIRFWMLFVILNFVALYALFSLYIIFFSKSPSPQANDASKVMIGFVIGSATNFLNL